MGLEVLPLDELGIYMYPLSNKRSAFFLAIAILLAGSASCLRRSQPSELAIDSGQVIKVDYANKVSGVVSIGGCTATIVSTNTLLFAAHCAPAGTKICIATPPYNGLCSIKYQTNGVGQYVNAANSTIISNGNWSQDLSVAIFDGQPFKHIFPVTDRKPTIGEQNIMVGYSMQNLPDPSSGSKRWGFNRIAGLNYLIGGIVDNSIVSVYGGNQQSVTVDVGDSGGPLFNAECKVMGSASRKSANNRGQKISYHTNIFSPTSQTFLESMVAQGAHFCKAGENSAQCPAAYMYSRVQNPQAEPDGAPGFPCVQGANDNRLAVFTRAADATSSDKAIVYFATSVSGKTYGYCLNTSAEACTPSTDGFKVVKDLGATSVRKLYKIVEPYQVSRDSKIAMVIYSNDNKLIASRVVSIEPKASTP